MDFENLGIHTIFACLNYFEGVVSIPKDKI